MSPSSTIHWCWLLVLLLKSRNVTDTRPSRHSRVCGGCRGGRASEGVCRMAKPGLHAAGPKALLAFKNNAGAHSRRTLQPHLRVQVAVELIAGDRLGVDGAVHGALPPVVLRLHQRAPDGRLAAASGAQQEDGPPHDKLRALRAGRRAAESGALRASCQVQLPMPAQA
jgi:hypothetical protein